MAMETGSDRSSRQWEAEQLRATTFVLPEGSSNEPSTWWDAVVGGQPDEEITRAKEGVVQQTGTFGGKPISVVLRPERVDWMIQSSVVRPDVPPAGFPLLGPFVESLELLLRIAERWLEYSPPVHRLALGAVLLKPVLGHEEGYAELQKSLPSVQIGANNTADFFFQINRYRMSRSVDGLRVNRLTKWALLSMGSIGISLGPGVGTVLPSAPAQFACRLELDINSAPMTGQIPRHAAWPLFQELADLGKEIAEKGDIQ